MLIVVRLAHNLEHPSRRRGLQTRANYPKLLGQKVFPTMDDREAPFCAPLYFESNNELGIADIKHNPITGSFKKIGKRVVFQKCTHLKSKN